jgi:hypothetical protein
MGQTKQSFQIIAIFLWVAHLMFSLCFAQKIKIENKDGVTIVHNPKKPAKVTGAPNSLTLEEDLCIGVESGDEDYMFAQLRSVQVDEEEDIIVLDWKYNVVKVFDKNGKHIRTFGKHGQGPGEIQGPSRMYLKGGKDIGILDSANNRFSYFSKEGECLKETSLGKNVRIFRAIPDSRGFLYGDTFILDGNIRKDSILKFDPEFNLVSTVTSFEKAYTRRELNPVREGLVYQVMADDCLIWAHTYEYALHVLDPEGKLIKKIIKDYKQIKITEKNKEKIIKDMWGDQPPPSGLKIAIPKHYPPMYYLLGDDKGRIYIRTYERDSKGQIKWDVFDKEGRFILSFFHPEKDIVFVFKNDKAYSMILESEEEGIPLVKRYKMTWE